MGKTTKQLYADMKKGGALMRLMTVVSIIKRYEKSLKAQRSESRDVLMEIIKEDSLSMVRYAAYTALCAERRRNEAVRRSVEEFESDPRNNRVIALMSEES